jgi:hypothetical protein
MGDPIQCKSNSGFEDQLTEKSWYHVQEVGENGYQVVNDKGELRYYGDVAFERR